MCTTKALPMSFDTLIRTFDYPLAILTWWYREKSLPPAGFIHKQHVVAAMEITGAPREFQRNVLSHFQACTFEEWLWYYEKVRSLELNEYYQKARENLFAYACRFEHWWKLRQFDFGAEESAEEDTNRHKTLEGMSTTGTFTDWKKLFLSGDTIYYDISSLGQSRLRELGTWDDWLLAEEEARRNMSSTLLELSREEIVSLADTPKKCHEAWRHIKGKDSEGHEIFDSSRTSKLLAKMATF